MSDTTRLEAIEIKLAHLERAAADLNDVVIRQQQELDLALAQNRQLSNQLKSLDSSPGASATAHEKPPHY